MFGFVWNKALLYFFTEVCSSCLLELCSFKFCIFFTNYENCWFWFTNFFLIVAYEICSSGQASRIIKWKSTANFIVWVWYRVYTNQVWPVSTSFMKVCLRNWRKQNHWFKQNLTITYYLPANQLFRILIRFDGFHLISHASYKRQKYTQHHWLEQKNDHLKFKSSTVSSSCHFPADLFKNENLRNLIQKFLQIVIWHISSIGFTSK